MNKRMPITLAATVALLTAPAAAHAGASVDPGSLNPVPPDWMTCQADGSNTICRGSDVFDDAANAPTGLDCSGQEIYATGTDVRSATRTYDADGDLDWRRVHAAQHYAWRLTPDASGPAVSVDGHYGWTIRYAVHGDTSTGSLTAHGLETRAAAPDGRVLLHDAGTQYIDADGNVSFHGQWPLWTDFDASLATICAALGAP